MRNFIGYNGAGKWLGLMAKRPVSYIVEGLGVKISKTYIVTF